MKHVLVIGPKKGTAHKDVRYPGDASSRIHSGYGLR